jgi:hypothetical protein
MRCQSRAAAFRLSPHFCRRPRSARPRMGEMARRMGLKEKYLQYVRSLARIMTDLLRLGFGLWTLVQMGCRFDLASIALAVGVGWTGYDRRALRIHGLLLLLCALTRRSSVGSSSVLQYWLSPTVSGHSLPILSRRRMRLRSLKTWALNTIRKNMRHWRRDDCVCQHLCLASGRVKGRRRFVRYCALVCSGVVTLLDRIFICCIPQA